MRKRTNVWNTFHQMTNHRYCTKICKRCFRCFTVDLITSPLIQSFLLISSLQSLYIYSRAISLQTYAELSGWSSFWSAYGEVTSPKIALQMTMIRNRVSCDHWNNVFWNLYNQFYATCPISLIQVWWRMKISWKVSRRPCGLHLNPGGTWNYSSTFIHVYICTQLLLLFSLSILVPNLEV